MSDNANVSVQVTNYPPSGSDEEVRELVLGGKTAPATLLIETTYNDEGEGETDIRVTVSNLCESKDLVDRLDETIELLTKVRDNAPPRSNIEEQG